MRVAAAAVLVLLAASCSGLTRVQVAAAASLTGVLTEIGRSYEATHPGVGVEFTFAGTPTLVAQIEEGAPVDVFASADEENMTRVVEADLVAGAPRLFAHNRLVIAVAPGNPLGVAGLADLAGLRTALGAEGVPVGRYAAATLDMAGVVLSRAAEEPSVAAILAKLTLGEVDAGIVYQTDVVAAGDAVTGIPIPADLNVEASYLIAALSTSAVPAEAGDFVDFVLSPAGRAILAGAGFEAP